MVAVLQRYFCVRHLYDESFTLQLRPTFIQLGHTFIQFRPTGVKFQCHPRGFHHDIVKVFDKNAEPFTSSHINCKLEFQFPDVIAH